MRWLQNSCRTPLSRWVSVVGIALLAAGVSFGEDLAARKEKPGAPQDGAHGLQLELFYEEGCSECEALERNVLPGLEIQFRNRFRLTWYDTSCLTNYLRLVAYQERLGVEGNPNVYLVLEGEEAFSGLREISERLPERMEIRLREDPSQGSVTPFQPSLDDAASWEALRRRFDSFTFWGVAMAGLIDGINPCAISALVFFISMLSVAGLRGKTLLMTGVIFIASVYVTYFSLGFGAFRFFDWIARNGEGWRYVLERGMIVVLLVFAFLSLRDAWCFRRSRNPKEIKLQLSDGMKTGVRRVIRHGLGLRSLAFGAIVIGVSVTLIESVCTGQVYVPSLVWLVRAGHAGRRAIGYLALYNFMHVVPLIAAFVLTWRGMQTPALIHWSRRNVVLSKSLMALFFLGMAALLIWL